MYSHTCCVDYTQSTRLYTDLLHCMHCVVQSMSNYYTIQCKFLPFIWKNLHRAEKFTRTPSLASLTNMRYAATLGLRLNISLQPMPSWLKIESPRKEAFYGRILWILFQPMDKFRNPAKILTNIEIWPMNINIKRISILFGK